MPAQTPARPDLSTTHESGIPDIGNMSMAPVEPSEIIEPTSEVPPMGMEMPQIPPGDVSSLLGTDDQPPAMTPAPTHDLSDGLPQMENMGYDQVRFLIFFMNNCFFKNLEGLLEFYVFSHNLKYRTWDMTNTIHQHIRRAEFQNEEDLLRLGTRKIMSSHLLLDRYEFVSNFLINNLMINLIINLVNCIVARGTTDGRDLRAV